MRIAISACGFVLFGLVAVHGPWGAQRIETILQKSAQNRLDEAGFEWTRVDADGQRLVLSGVAPDAEQRLAAVALSKEAVGPGGLAVGGVTAVDSRFTTARAEPPPAPVFASLADYRFEAALGEKQLHLSGMIPSDRARKALIAMLDDDGAIAVTDETEIAPLADASGWLSAAESALHALLMLDEGAVRQDGRAFTLSGLARSDAVALAAESLAAGAAGSFAFAVDIEGPPPAPSVEELANVCRAAITRAQNGRRLTFRPNSASLSESDRAFLDRFSGEISACGGWTVAIEGHTDSVGAAVDNLALSRRRAEAVETYLKSAGGETSYIVKAYGETQPIASNRTAAGQRSNRRIDFVLAERKTDSG